MSTKRHSILPQAEEFLHDAMDIPIVAIEEDTFKEYVFADKDYNSMLSISSSDVSLIAVASYDVSLIDQIVKNFMEITKIAEDEKEELYLDASGEIINIIVGLASPRYIEKGMDAEMGTPLKVTSAKDIKLSGKYSVLNEKIFTDFGSMDLSIISSIKDN